MDPLPTWSPYTHTRNVSLDSTWSHNPSLADSVTRLLPQSPHVDLGRQSRFKAPSKGTKSNIKNGLPEPSAKLDRADLTSEQRQALRRRAKVLEKRLGVPLREDQRGQWVLDPPQEHHSSSSENSHRRDNSVSLASIRCRLLSITGLPSCTEVCLPTLALSPSLANPVLLAYSAHAPPANCVAWVFQD
jgi:hypothetical protein